jgi:hypothetical protein
MDFKSATDILFGRVTHEDLAARLQMSVAIIRQARLSPAAHGHRQPPIEWRKAVVELAEKRAAELQQLVASLATHPEPR